MQTGTGLRTLTAEQQFLLERLFQLIALQQSRTWGYMNEAGHTLVTRSIYAVYCDCVDAGVTAEAQTLLDLLPRITVTRPAVTAGDAHVLAG